MVRRRLLADSRENVLTGAALKPGVVWETGLLPPLFFEIAFKCIPDAANLSPVLVIVVCSGGAVGKIRRDSSLRAPVYIALGWIVAAFKAKIIQTGFLLIGAVDRIAR